MQGSTKRVDEKVILNTLKYDIMYEVKGRIKPSFGDIADSINNYQCWQMGICISTTAPSLWIKVIMRAIIKRKRSVSKLGTVPLR